MAYLNKIFNKQQTPQSDPIPGSAQVPNSAGGYSFPVDDWVRLDRFLILGSEGGSYYATEHALTLENAQAVLRCIEADGPRTVARIAAISDAGRAPKNDPALFALALCTAAGDEATRRAALAALPQVARIGTHLFHFAAYVQGFRGWGRGLRNGIARWYNAMPPDRLAYQAMKYQQRDGWSHRDLLRLAHPKSDDATRNAIYKWVVEGWEWVGDGPHPDPVLVQLWAFERLKRATAKAEVLRLIRDYNLPRETVPTEWLNDSDVWAALLEHMPLTALIRNLGKMTSIGLIAPLSDTVRAVTDRLRDEAALRQARVHPIAVLAALLTYSNGKGVRGSLHWTPVQPVLDALNVAFYQAFGNVPPTDKRWYLALDVSGSMGGGMVAGVPGLTPRVASAAMALITANVEAQHTIVGFSAAAGGIGGQWGGGDAGLTPVPISPGQRLDDVVKITAVIPMGGTDCSLPMRDALKHKRPVDVFVVYTDSETWAGDIHPVQALQQYRDRMGIPARLIVVGMVSNGFTIADPNDAGMMDVVGFDLATPALMSDFASEGQAAQPAAAEAEEEA
jgi:60 kDa SS-A/Ro ribonucleoprotein